jgi:hypothetical protein
MLEGSITFNLQVQTWSIQQKFEEYHEKRVKLMKVMALLLIERAALLPVPFQKNKIKIKVMALYFCKLQFYFCCFLSWLCILGAYWSSSSSNLLNIYCNCLSFVSLCRVR